MINEENTMMTIEDAKFWSSLFIDGMGHNMYYDETIKVLKENGEDKLIKRIEKRLSAIERTIFQCNVEDMLGTQDRYGMCGIEVEEDFEDADGVLTLA